MNISALVVAKNEEPFIKGCIERILPFVDEVIFVDNESTDKTKEIVEKIGDNKIKIFTHPLTDNMGDLRQFSLDQATGEWIWQVDADEWYEKEDCEAIQRAVNDPGEAISFRVGYHQLSWRKGFKQANFEHYPDRLYKRDVVDKYDGMLPNDMTKVKRGIFQHRPFLEYDNQLDQSFENPRQPILPVKYYHLARTRGYNFEYNKWYRYNQITHSEWDHDTLHETTRINQWVSGLYDIEPVAIPFEIPKVTPKVSIIIPNFQYEEYVGKAIESAQKQTTPPHEIIVIDDGSHDNSKAVISQYDVDLKCIPNGGVACARNAGAYRATGDYLIFLDADDELNEKFIEETIGNDEQITYTDYELIGDQGGFVGEPDYSLEEMRKGQLVPSTVALVDKRVWELVGGFDNGEIYEDWGFWLRCATKGFDFEHIKQPLLKYRIHGRSRVDELDAKMIEGYAQLKERYQITREINIDRIKEAQKICG